ncbi:LysR family transcriptional regulator [Pseudomonas tremae]|uniref:LysR family transcriptional regulator n=3 Tax=Pseudomonas coronafaciens TaxID=53409 RepID=A0AAE6UNA8_9PSED|nr:MULTISPECIES: LysR family transcriptional regulator [Pseudomonas syringae group]MCQ2990671.1 LysR family transcriptional regulator [Pseudomonas tremae]MCQ3014084.1 LysR family transcriptional regulator [Pseudomonas tremae]QGL57331.1 LysR family transcriptional regulator [Pseudomonas coronafaciens pv. oryzae str. 1_6]QGT82346.1 LysR family transcriptional regulator [Pseudomonas coronafaciens pv. coronafaciens]QIQ70154.1 HTH-type transcriptional regulator YofA [Pseudomonas coronafaciens]
MIKELKTFIAVARDGTFAAAGDRIGLTQAAVSAQMQRLEAELGVKLFDRTGRSAQLNRMGQQVLLQAQELLQLYGNLGSDAVGLAPDVLVTLGAIASVQRSFLPDALALFHQQCPQCRTRIIPGLSMDLVNQVDAGEIDLAAIIRPPFSLHSDLRWTTLTREPYCLIVPADVRGDDWSALISNQPFIRYDRSSFGGRQVDRFLRQTHVALREVCELDELDAIVKLVANGVGVALVPQTATLQAWPAGVRAVDLGQHTFHRDIGLVHRARRSLAEPVKELARLLTAQGQEVQ